MNEIFIPGQKRPATRGAEGLPRWRWTAAEIERMAAAGYFHEQDRLELLGGEIVPTSPKGRRHEIVRVRLAFDLSRSAPSGVIVASEPQLNLSQDTFVIPDILVHPAAIETPDVSGSDTLLVVEVAETSLAGDIKVKLPLYAAHGVREYWVINAVTLVTTMHREPSEGTYAFAQEVTADQLLVPTLVPAMAVSLNGLAHR
jgi:Uma2 family endonuclease